MSANDVEERLMLSLLMKRQVSHLPHQFAVVHIVKSRR
jgi:hypothetical protein